SAAAMQRALRDQPLPEALCRQLLEVANRSARPRVVNVPPGQAAPILAQSVTNRDYRSLAGLGIDSVLEIRIERQRFKADESAPNPPMSFDATVIVYITRIDDGTLLFAGPLEYCSRKRRFCEWGGEEAKHFRKELNRAQRVLAGMMFEQLFSNP